jgi:hypothetical protein
MSRAYRSRREMNHFRAATPPVSCRGVGKVANAGRHSAHRSIESFVCFKAGIKGGIEGDDAVERQCRMFHFLAQLMLFPCVPRSVSVDSDRHFDCTTAKVSSLSEDMTSSFPDHDGP